MDKKEIAKIKFAVKGYLTGRKSRRYRVNLVLGQDGVYEAERLGTGEKFVVRLTLPEGSRAVPQHILSGSRIRWSVEKVHSVKQAQEGVVLKTGRGKVFVRKEVS